MISVEILKAAAEHAHNNSLELIAKSDACACFCCTKKFHPNDINEWHTEKRGSYALHADKLTALCPFCGIDSIIGSGSGYELTDDFIHDMNYYWFQTYKDMETGKEIDIYGNEVKEE